MCECCELTKAVLKFKQVSNGDINYFWYSNSY